MSPRSGAAGEGTTAAVPAGRRDRVAAAVVVVAAVGLVARLVGLGARPFHWDEARVGYWTLRALETGAFGYRPVAGGPLLYVVGRPVLALLGPSDFAARLPVAVGSALLPLAALLLRGRLRDDETVVLAALLAADPLLVYYGRFLRGDVLAAGLGLVAVGAAVRLHDGDRRYAPVLAAAVALAVGASGFAVAYPLAWLVAGGLVLDHDRLRRRPARALAAVAAVRDRLRDGARTAVGALAVGALVHLFLFAPRTGGGPGPGLWRPATLPAVVEAAFVGSARRFVGVRIVGRAPDGTHELLPYLAAHGRVLLAGALPVLALAVGALLWDRYRVGGPRALPAFAAYWGLFGLLLFPVVTEVSAPWVAVHTVVPLAVPAAVGGAAVLRAGVRAAADRRSRTVAAAGLIALAALTQTGAVAAGAVYGPSTPDNALASYGQPADDLDGFAADVRAAAGGSGVDVLYVGDELSAPGDVSRPPVGESWGERLPLPWYTERAGATVDDARSADAIEEPAPVVVTVPERRSAVAGRLGDGYEVTGYRLGLWNREVVVFVRG